MFLAKTEFSVERLVLIADFIHIDKYNYNMSILIDLSDGVMVIC